MPESVPSYDARDSDALLRSCVSIAPSLTTTNRVTASHYVSSALTSRGLAGSVSLGHICIRRWVVHLRIPAVSNTTRLQNARCKSEGESCSSPSLSSMESVGDLRIRHLRACWKAARSEGRSVRRAKLPYEYRHDESACPLPRF